MHQKLHPSYAGKCKDGLALWAVPPMPHIFGSAEVLCVDRIAASVLGGKAISAYGSSWLGPGISILRLTSEMIELGTMEKTHRSKKLRYDGNVMLQSAWAAQA